MFRSNVLCLLEFLFSSSSLRVRAAFFHLVLSLACALIVAVLVLYVWYPPPYDVLSGGSELFWLVVSVDVAVGPLLTLIVFNIKKRRAELLRDLVVIGMLQVCALAYGLHTVFVARPVALVLEIDRFRVVAANDVYEGDPSQVASEFRSMALLGPRLVGVRKPEGKEAERAVDLMFKGYDVGQCPQYWKLYDAAAAVSKARKLEYLVDRKKEFRADIESRVKAMGGNLGSSYYMPVLARQDGWVAILDSRGHHLGFLPYDQ